MTETASQEKVHPEINLPGCLPCAPARPIEQLPLDLPSCQRVSTADASPQGCSSHARGTRYSFFIREQTLVPVAARNARVALAILGSEH